MQLRLINFLLPLLILCVSVDVWGAEPFVEFTPSHDSQIVLGEGRPITLFIDPGDDRAARRAFESLRADLKAVTGLETMTADASDAQIVIGTIGKSAVIDKLVRQKKIDGGLLEGKREAYVIATVDGQLIIAGSDRRGTVYGIYELSRQAGVSPWYWWADAPIARHSTLYVRGGVYTDGSPAVRYRGIFLNDEAPCLTSWVRNTWGTDYGDHRFYERVFELVLRLRGNMIWPAMWGWAFYADDELNSKTADDMGVIIGTSHHEPMARNHQEWARHRAEYGQWNYKSNQQTIDRFFREGVERAKDTEDIITIGMRGDGDEAMSAEADTKLLEEIVANQRRIIADVTNRPAEETPQVWALYKEVLDYYDKGMRVPDDVIMLLCDDNWGNVRRLPNAREREHPGGWGLYYHVDYVGAPRNSKWINATPTQNMWEQLTLAYDGGIDRMWILNVGDLKPMEYPIQLFLDMAWNPKEYTAATLTDHTRRFCAQQWGEEQAEEAARLLNLAYKYNGRSTAEMLNDTTYSLRSGEWRQVVEDYTRLETEALRQFITLPVEAHDSYRQIVLFPIQAMGNLHAMYYAVAMNRQLYSEANPDCNIWARRAEEAFRRDSLLQDEYNTKIANGKWNGMMTQKHIGYTSWNDDFPCDVMPEVYRIEERLGGNVFTAKDGVVSMEAEHFYSQQPAEDTQWTVIPYMGRTLSGVALMPYTKDVTGASLSYRFRSEDMGKVEVHIFVKSTLDYLNQGGLRYQVSIDGAAPTVVNFNEKLNEAPENVYTTYYPTVARRVVESVVPLTLSPSADGFHTLTFSPLDPGIVVEKIVVDLGGYIPSYLGMEESPRKQELAQ